MRRSARREDRFPEGRALVIGGRGQMGRWFVRFLGSEGYEVATSDLRGALRGFQDVPDWSRHAEEFDLLVFATPMDRTAALLRRARGVRKPVVLDICSIKTPVLKEIRALVRRGARVASTHPMWGPDADLLSDKNLLILDCGSEAGVRAARAIFGRTAVSIHELPIERHDALMAWSLGLPHAANLVFSSALRSSGVKPAELLHLGGPTMKAQLFTASQVARENKELYFQIQSLNPHTREVQRALAAALRDFAASLRGKREFSSFMRACERYYRDGAP